MQISLNRMIEEYCNLNIKQNILYKSRFHINYDFMLSGSFSFLSTYDSKWLSHNYCLS